VRYVHLASPAHALQHAEPGDLVAEVEGSVFDAAARPLKSRSGRPFGHVERGE